MQRNWERWKKIWWNANENRKLREEDEWIDGDEKHNMRTLRSMHKFQKPNWPSRRKAIRGRRSTNEIKWEGKIREKRVKRNEQSLQDIWDYVKRPNLRLIGVPECDGENESKLENTLQDIIQENFPNLARQANIQV